MKIAFADFIDWSYTVETAYQKPLGGTQSAVCYLAEALAQQGHEVFLINRTTETKISRGVMCLNLETLYVELLQSLDALILICAAEPGKDLKKLVGKQTLMMLWTQYAHDQPLAQELHNRSLQEVYDGIALVSNWQRDRFHENFGVDLHKIGIMRNAIAPSFYNLFSDQTPILSHKSNPPVLAYTSTPFRGLDILVEVFPRIRQAIPGTRLKVFSSMKVYQASEAKDKSEYGSLYRQCQETEGVEYIGSVSQSDLAREMRSVTALAYPNTFPETSCIAVMEAMASGCAIVTSDLAALPETTAGFASLIPVESDWEIYKERFVAETIQVLKKYTATDTREIENHLQHQVQYVNNSYTWSVRAQEWVEWLNNISRSNNSQIFQSSNLQQQAYQYLIQNDYTQAASLYEQAIEADSSIASNYWYLGLILLLQGQKEEAQTTWMLAMVNGEPEQVELWTAQLLEVLKAEANRQESNQEEYAVEMIKQCIAEISGD